MPPAVTRLLAVLLIAAAALGSASASARILPLGDSITHGGVGDHGVLHPSYRAWLYQDLRARGFDVDFVGSLHTPCCQPVSTPTTTGTPGSRRARSKRPSRDGLPGAPRRGSR